MTLPKPGQRIHSYRPHLKRRKATYPDDDKLVAMVNFTSEKEVAKMLGISTMALSYYLHSTGLIDRLFISIRRNYLRKIQSEKQAFADMMFRKPGESDPDKSQDLEVSPASPRENESPSLPSPKQRRQRSSPKR